MRRYNPKNAGADDVGFVDVPNGDEAKLQAAVATQGPVSVAIDASLETFQLYSDGVYFDENCSTENLDHGVSVLLCSPRTAGPRVPLPGTSPLGRGFGP